MATLDEDFLFADEETTEEEYVSNSDGFWKVLVVDDEKEVHNVTKLVFSNFQFKGKELEFYHAYSSEDAIDLLRKNHDIAVVFLDVVMEEDNSGLKLVDFIRNDIKNDAVRIILRTGQPGQAPERKVIIDYDINDYKEKTELTAQKLFTTMVSSLRAYNDIMTIGNNKKGLEKVIESSSIIFELQTLRKFGEGVLTQLASILDVGNSIFEHSSGFMVSGKADKFYVLSGIGSYKTNINKNIKQVADEEILTLIQECISEKKNIFNDKFFIIFLGSELNAENLIYMECNRKITEIDKDLIKIFSSNVTIAFDNISLNNEVENTQREVIFTLGEIAEARSNETGHHVKRVAEYSKLLALKYGLGSEEADIIKLASPMHDVGKLAIPDAILNKPGKLTVDEFDIMKTHTIVGYDMLKNSNKVLMKTAAIIALEHHEKFDGTGYPRGLAGEDIHIYGRITALADVFDALGSERVYKKAWELSKILKLFKDERGKHFDPALVDLFFANLDEILEIRQKFNDEFNVE